MDRPLKRVVVTGATGNVGTAVLDALVADERVSSIVGLARRMPTTTMPKVEWVSRDVANDDLAEVFDGADAVVHLAWLIQPGRDQKLLEAVNVHGSRRVFEAAGRAGVPAIVHASSVGTYSPRDGMMGTPGNRVDESWPVDGIPSSYYSRQKAAVEAILDGFEAAHPATRVVRLRPALIFKRESAVEQQRLFLGRYFPRRMISKRVVPALPKIGGLSFQALHADDVADAYRRAIFSQVSGAFNIAEPDVIDMPRVAELFDARVIGKLPGSALRAVASITWHLRLQPAAPGWIDMALQSPVMDTARAHELLGWRPTSSGLAAIGEFLAGLSVSGHRATPPLALRPSDVTR